MLWLLQHPIWYHAAYKVLLNCLGGGSGVLLAI